LCGFATGDCHFQGLPALARGAGMLVKGIKLAGRMVTGHWRYWGCYNLPFCRCGQLDGRAVELR